MRLRLPEEHRRTGLNVQSISACARKSLRSDFGGKPAMVLGSEGKTLRKDLRFPALVSNFYGSSPQAGRKNLGVRRRADVAWWLLIETRVAKAIFATF
jgi:hypothetical protein